VKGTLVVFRREIAGLFFTPLGWVLFFLALVLNGLLFGIYLQASDGRVNEAFSIALGYGTQFWLIVVVLPPLLTMRMLSEESRTGMLEFLMTAPVGDAAIVVGKLLAATAFLALIWTSTLVYGVVLQALGAGPDWGQLLAAYLGACLVSGLFCAAGLVASSLTSAPILSAFLATLFNVGLLVAAFLAPRVGGRVGGVVTEVTSVINVPQNLQGSFLIGVFDSAHVVFFLAWTAVFVVLATRILEARRWW